LWLHSLKVAQLLRSAACLHTNHSRSYLNHLVHGSESILRKSLSFSFSGNSLGSVAGTKLVTSMADVQITFTGTLFVKKPGERHWLFRHALISFIYTKEKEVAHISEVFLEILIHFWCLQAVIPAEVLSFF